MIFTPLKSMMPDRPDMTRTVKIMSGRTTGRTGHTPTECPSVRGCFDDRSLYGTILSNSANESYLGRSSPVARQAHNLKIAGSNPAPTTK